MDGSECCFDINICSSCVLQLLLPAFVPGVHAENQQCYKCKRARGSGVSTRKTPPVSLRRGRGLRKSDTSRTRHVSVLGTITHTTTGTANLPCFTSVHDDRIQYHSEAKLWKTSLGGLNCRQDPPLQFSLYRLNDVSPALTLNAPFQYQDRPVEEAQGDKFLSSAQLKSHPLSFF